MSTPLVDPAVFAELQATAGVDFVPELVRTFAEEAPQMLAMLRAARGDAEADRFRRTAHSLKSNSATFGARPLAEAARDLELGGCAAGDAQRLAALEAVLNDTLAELRRLAHG